MALFLNINNKMNNSNTIYKIKVILAVYVLVTCKFVFALNCHGIFNNEKVSIDSVMQLKLLNIRENFLRKLESQSASYPNFKYLEYNERVFEIIQPLGWGGESWVYLAKEGDSYYAIKKFKSIPIMNRNLEKRKFYEVKDIVEVVAETGEYLIMPAKIGIPVDVLLDKTKSEYELSNDELFKIEAAYEKFESRVKEDVLSKGIEPNGKTIYRTNVILDIYSGQFFIVDPG